MEIHARNINQAFSKAIPILLNNGMLETSRNGAVIVMPSPTLIRYDKPTERVLFSPKRDANPFFHLMESLWMLAGRQDIQFPKYFNSRFGEYSDDGITAHGAYGHRWRCAFGYDQLEIIADELQSNPDSRRCVLAMWDAHSPITLGDEVWGKDDLHKASIGGKDVPCNTHAYFDARGGKLNMTVCNRSNDAIWGVFGANVVQFSVMQEYLAAWVGIPVGEYRQFTNNLHAYLQTYDTDKLRAMALDAGYNDPYTNNNMKPMPLVSTGIEIWNRDLALFMENPGSSKLYDPFFVNVAQPMFQAWLARKEKTGTGREQAGHIEAPDWRGACLAWIDRKEKPLYA